MDIDAQAIAEGKLNAGDLREAKRMVALQLAWGAFTPEQKEKEWLEVGADSPYSVLSGFEPQFCRLCRTDVFVTYEDSAVCPRGHYI